MFDWNITYNWRRSVPNAQLPQWNARGLLNPEEVEEGEAI
jgi:hypothetical protein